MPAAKSLTSQELDELLRPTLTEEDDAVAFDRPWNPTTIVLLSFFFGAVAGGALLAFNSRRLGQNRRFWPLLIGSLIFAICCYAVMFFVLTPVVAAWDPTSRQMARLPVRAATVFAAWIAGGPQRRRYRLATISNVPLGSLWGLGTGIVILGLLIELVIATGIGVLSLPGLLTADESI